MIGIQQHVAARECQSLLVSHGGTGDDFDGQVQVSAELSDDQLLLEVLLSEVGRVGCGDIEHLDDDGGHALEVSSPELAFEDVTQWPHVDGCLSLGGVDGLFVWSKDEIDAQFTAKCQVVLERSGVALEVVGVVELGCVDKQCRHDEPTVGHGSFDQAGVTTVQGAHGRHAADTSLVSPRPGDQLANLFDTPGRPHPPRSRLVRTRPVRVCSGYRAEKFRVTSRRILWSGWRFDEV